MVGVIVENFNSVAYEGIEVSVDCTAGKWNVGYLAIIIDSSHSLLYCGVYVSAMAGQ